MTLMPDLSFSNFRLSRGVAAIVLSFVISGCASVDAMRRVEVDFEYVADIAQDLSQREYRVPAPLPEALRNLNYDEYRKIRYNADEYLWKNEGLPFSLGFFHPGFLHRDQVKVNEFTSTHAQRIRYLKEFFEFDDKALEDSMPSDLDYAGLRLAYSQGDAKDYREIISFLGASYFRGTGFDTRYGTSARGISIDTGLGKPEEFPKFTEVWLGKPLTTSNSVQMFALLEGPSVTGAYEFLIRPGDTTVTEVKARLFFRKAVESLGIAPLTSMYWRGENRTGGESDYRPEVHDTDGLLVMESDEDPIWRAIDIGQSTRLSFFGVDKLKGFGLMQRDRRFESYQDLEAEYHKRPSVWVEAKGDWGDGFLKLVELPTRNEFEDNVVAFWEPSVLPEAGDVLEYEYKIHWSPMKFPESHSDSYVVATRKGADPSYPGTEVFVIDFSAPVKAQPEEGEEEVKPEQVEEEQTLPEIVAVAEGGSEIMEKHVMWNKYSKTWRVVLRLKEIGPEHGVTEVRCQLLFDKAKSSEEWAYQWTR